MLPLRDLNPTIRRPVVTIALIAICTAIYLFVQPHEQGDVDDAEFSFKTAAIPCEVVNTRPLTQREVVETLRDGDENACNRQPDGSPPAFPGKQVLAALIYSMFLHGSLVHLGGNMLFLWIFGNNIEDSRGHIQYVTFYVVAGLVATIAHVVAQPNSTVPLVGASGAIAGVMGAYLVLFPNAPIRTLFFLAFFIFFRDVSAKWLLALWFVSQFFINPSEGVAWLAHVGGFVFGVLVGLVWRAWSRPAPEPARSFAI